MSDDIRRIVEVLLRLLLPASGAHRAPGDRGAGLRGDASRQRERQRRLRTERWLRCQRRRVLWLAVHGVDTGPRWIHGVKVAAAR